MNIRGLYLYLIKTLGICQEDTQSTPSKILLFNYSVILLLLPLFFMCYNREEAWVAGDLERRGVPDASKVRFLTCIKAVALSAFIDAEALCVFLMA